MEKTPPVEVIASSKSIKAEVPADKSAHEVSHEPKDRLPEVSHEPTDPLPEKPKHGVQEEIAEVFERVEIKRNTKRQSTFSQLKPLKSD